MARKKADSICADCLLDKEKFCPKCHCSGGCDNPQTEGVDAENHFSTKETGKNHPQVQIEPAIR